MRLRDTLEKIIEKQHELNLILVRLTSTVEEHVKRSDNLERHVDQTAAKLEAESKEMKVELDEVRRHVAMVNGFAKICAWAVVVIGGLIAIVVSLQKLISFLQ